MVFYCSEANIKLDLSESSSIIIVVISKISF